MKAAVYTRISSDPSGQGAGVARQRADALALADLKGWTVADAHLFEDNDKSATSGKRRPEFDRMIGAVESGEVDAIVCWHLDRLVRLMSDLVRVIDVGQPRRLNIATVHGVSLDMGDPTGVAVAQILTAIAQMEVAHKAERQRSANRQRAERGVVSTGGIRTLGYKRGMTVVIPEEADHIRSAFEDMITGSSLRSIARRWNHDTEFRTAHDGKWTPFGVRMVLRNPRYAGRSIHQGEVVGTGQWEALVSDDVFDAVQAILDDPDRRTTPSTARRYLLPGIARCACGGDIRTGRTQHGKRTYFCAVSKHLSRAAVDVDAWITELSIERLAQPEAADLLLDKERVDIVGLRNEAAALRIRLDQVADMVADGELDRQQGKRATERIRTRMDKITLDMADRAATEVLGPFVAAAADAPDLDGRRDRVAARWDGADLDIRRAVIGVLFDSIVLHPPGRGARNFDPSTITWNWRTP